MKKLYMKPVASNIAYAVNENIAKSGFIVGDPGDVDYTQFDRSECTRVIINTGVETGVLPGVTNIHEVLNALYVAASIYPEGSEEWNNTPYAKLSAWFSNEENAATYYC